MDPTPRAPSSSRLPNSLRRAPHGATPTAVDPAARARGCTAGDVILVAAPFVWLGMVLAISFVETPLKFHAPGITLPLGLQIGRLVFPALNLLEVISGLTVAALLLRRRALTPRRVWGLLAGLWVVLITQAFLLRPVLDDRAATLIAGAAVPDAPWHLLYIALELLKVIGLAVLGAALVALTVRAASHVSTHEEARDG